MVSRECYCAEWAISSPEIDGAIILADNHNMGLSPDYTFWKYCPWCGELLTEINDEKEMV